MAYGDKHPCPNCGKEHDERETLNKCTRCGQVYCGNGGSTYVTWNPTTGKLS